VRDSPNDTFAREQMEDFILLLFIHIPLLFSFQIPLQSFCPIAIAFVHNKVMGKKGEGEDDELDNLSAAGGGSNDDDDDDDDDDDEPQATARPRYLRRRVGRVCACSAIVGVVCLVSGLTATIFIRRSNESTNPAWVEMRWIDDGDCPPAHRMANSQIYCANGNGPFGVSDDGTKYCGGVVMESNSCTLPTSGRWMSSSTSEGGGGGESIAEPPPPLSRRFGIAKINPTNPQCETMEELIDGNYKGDIDDQEWVPKTCHAVPLTPFAWTRNTKCQATITMIVSVMHYWYILFVL
jgi:hypothetical protein